MSMAVQLEVVAGDIRLEKLFFISYIMMRFLLHCGLGKGFSRRSCKCMSTDQMAFFRNVDADTIHRCAAFPRVLAGLTEPIFETFECKY